MSNATEIRQMCLQQRPVDEPPDIELLGRIMAGDERAYEQVMRRYNQRMFRVVRSVVQDREEAKDVMQEAYINAFTKIKSFKGPQGFGAWLMKIAFNQALMRLRKQRLWSQRFCRDDVDEIAAATEYPSQHSQPEKNLANHQLRQLTERAIDELPANFRTVFILRAIDQLSLEETSQVVGIPVETVKTRFHRGRKLIRQKLSKQLEAAQLSVFEFDGLDCDQVVAAVLRRLGGG